MAGKTFVVERQDAAGRPDKIEVKADRAEVEGGGSSRVTFYNGEGDKSTAVASFINVQGWYEKGTQS